MAFGNAGPSTIFASIVFHWAPNALMPSAVIRSTTCDGTRVGGICGAGGAGAAGGAAGTCAPAMVAIIMGTTANAAQAMMNLTRSFLRISSSRFSCRVYVRSSYLFQWLESLESTLCLNNGTSHGQASFAECG